MKDTPAAALRRIQQRNQAYFDQFRDRAAQANLRQLRAASAALTLFLLAYGLITYFMLHSGMLALCYLTSGLAALPLLLFSLLYGRRRPPVAGTVQWACLLFMLVVMAFTVSISVFPFPNDPGIFYPLAYMLVIVLFILPFWQTALLLTGVTAVYALLVLLFKDSYAVQYDLFAGFTTWLLGFFFLYVVTDLRLRDGERLTELDRLSRTDPLTGLPNRRSMEDNVARGYRRCQRTGLWATVMMLDVDDFKLYNDRMGHQAGDACLRALGDVLRDYADELGVFAARYGGEEFLLFLSDCSEHDAVLAAQELLGHVRALALPFPGRGQVTVSIGLAAEKPGPETSYQRLLRRADDALYRAKSEGKDRMML